MTGNSINLVSAIGDSRVADALHIGSLIFCYTLGNTLYRALVHLHHTQPKPNAKARATASPLVVLMLALSDYWFFVNTKSVRHVLPLALGFGILNAATIDALGGTITFAMTGHLKTISHGLADRFFHSDPEKRRLQSPTKTSCYSLGSFLIGALVGTWLAKLGTQQAVERGPMIRFGNVNIPVFTTIGLLCALLLRHFDRPFPRPMMETFFFNSAKISNEEDQQRRQSGAVIS